MIQNKLRTLPTHNSSLCSNLHHYQGIIHKLRKAKRGRGFALALHKGLKASATKGRRDYRSRRNRDLCVR